MTKQNYDPSQVTVEINGQVLQTVFSTMESLKTPDIYSTQSLQINSLCEFARTLGYVPRDLDMISRGFEIVDMRSWHTHYISMSSMCKLHNGFLHRVIHLSDDVKAYDFLELKHIDIPTDKLELAWSNRLVERVKLQRDKSSYGGVKVQSNKVKLTDKGKEYCAQFDRYDFLFLED
ncbi:hypothetical protein AXI64_gp008 [Vibrio phage qdvp001]|uniref:hypothetical protein n=1 Tax=Vibrio phage qdvp001 TaxID=1003177 RepID=UPI00071F0B15|nr:hypothetical protein AXI64_gp008 [Vibrio phage qdvp001]ALM62000.1 hypothetical protein qdvp001_008 [Vibrio phage qdvp001]